MKKFKVAACLELGFYLEIEATDQKSAEALMMDKIKDEDIPIGSTTIHRDYFICDTIKIEAQK
jgi:hypothetical protein